MIKCIILFNQSRIYYLKKKKKWKDYVWKQKNFETIIYANYISIKCINFQLFLHYLRIIVKSIKVIFNIHQMIN